MNPECPNRERCGATGHVYEGGVWKRCSCLQQEINKRQLGIFGCPSPLKSTPLIKMTSSNLVIEGPLSQVRPHVAGAVVSLLDKGKTCLFMDAYRLVEIFVDKDEEFQSTQDVAEFDLFGMLLGFGDVLNRRLPDLILQVLSRRELKQIPTWVILGLPIQQVSTKYSVDVFEKIASFKKAQVK